MKNEEDLPISVERLFSKNIINYQVSTRLRGVRPYVNLDNAATTPPLLKVEKAVSDFFSSYGSVHRGSGAKSKISTSAYENAREEIKAFVNAPTDSYLVLTGNTTSAMNIAAHFFSFLKGKVAVSAIEHSSSWLPWIVAEGTKALGQEQVDIQDLSLLNTRIQESGRSQVLRYDVNENFEFDLDAIEDLLKSNQIKAFVLTAASNLTGYIPEIKAIGEIVHKYGAMFVVDACQFIQHHVLDMQELGIDFLAASGHKFYAPYGGGVLIGPKSFFDSFLPYQIGGGNLPYITKDGTFLRYDIEQAHDPGTPNAVGAISMAAALRELKTLGLEQIEQYESKLARIAYNELAKNPRVRLYVSSKHLSTVVSFSIDGIYHKEVAERLNSDFGVGVRAGSFCVYHAIGKLLAIDDESEIVAGVIKGDTSKIPGIIRASFSLCNTENDVKLFVDAINTITRELIN